MEEKELAKKANQARKLVIEMVKKANSGHLAGALGMADIFSVLYFKKVLNYRPGNPHWPERDRLVLSNGHICPIVYACCALAGLIPLEELKTLRNLNSRLQGHPHREDFPWIENTSGPLGEGLSYAIGLAIAGKLEKKQYYIFCIMSDGEQQAGNIWEAVMLANKLKLDNLIGVIDRNYIQIDGYTEEVMPLDPLKEKYLAFGWEVIEIDGHNYQEIISAFALAKKIKKPVIIIAYTIPGKGVSFMENDYHWHGKIPSKEEAEKAIEELTQKLK